MSSHASDSGPPTAARQLLASIRSLLGQYTYSHYYAFFFCVFVIFVWLFVLVRDLPASIRALNLALFTVGAAATKISAGDVRWEGTMQWAYFYLALVLSIGCILFQGNMAYLPVPGLYTGLYTLYAAGFTTFGLYQAFICATLLGGGRWAVTLFNSRPASEGTKPAEPMEPISVTPSSSEAHQLVLAARLALPLVVTVLFAVLPSLFFGHNVTFVVSKIYWFGITAYASSSLATARDTHLRMGSLQLTCFTICVLTVLIAQLAKTIVQVEPPVWDLQWIWQSLVLCAATAFCDGWAWMCAGCLSSSHQALWARVSTPDLCSEASTLPYYLS